MYVSAARALLETANSRVICLDIGSAGGFHPRLEAIRGCADLFGAEADPDECERLNACARPGERHINIAVGRDGERVTLELHRKRKTSSCYPTDPDRVRCFAEVDRLTPEGQVTFITRSLDAVCEAEGIARIDYLKVDVEGHELAVLEGYSGPLLVAEIEVNFYPFRIGVPTFDIVMRYMRERGFTLMDLRRTFWSPLSARKIRNYGAKGVLIHGDALFVLDPFLPSNYPALKTREARNRYLALLCLYGYAAEALAVLDVFKVAGLVALLIDGHDGLALRPGQGPPNLSHDANAVAPKWHHPNRALLQPVNRWDEVGASVARCPRTPPAGA